MDSACCNHMTPHSSLFSELKPAPHPPNIHTANSSTMSGHSIGSVSISNLSVPGVFNVPDLFYNLFSMGQLAVQILRWCGASLSSENKDE